MTTPDKFSRQVSFVRNLQRHGKGFFAINEWGPGPDYGLNPGEVPYNISGPENRAIRQFVTAAYMMVNGGSCGVYLTCIQCYGGHAGGLGNLSIWPEYSASVGHPLDEPRRDDTSGGWSRLYSQGLALVNPEEATWTVTLPWGNWSNLYGEALEGSVRVPAASGLALLRHPM